MSIPQPLGSGAGIDFLTGFQERNQRNLLEIFKAATPVMEEIAKVKPESWRNMKGLFSALEGTFGISQIGAGLTKPLSMLQNRASNIMEGTLAPIMIGINDLSNKVESFALQNQTGAIVGAGIGFAAGFVLPGGSILWGMVGGAIGASIEAATRSPTGISPTGGIFGGPGGFGFQGGQDPALQVSAVESPIVQLPFVRAPRQQMLDDLNRTRPGRQRGFAQFG